MLSMVLIIVCRSSRGLRLPRRRIADSGTFRRNTIFVSDGLLKIFENGAADYTLYRAVSYQVIDSYLLT